MWNIMILDHNKCEAVDNQPTEPRKIMRIPSFKQKNTSI